MLRVSGEYQITLKTTLLHAADSGARGLAIGSYARVGGDIEQVDFLLHRVEGFIADHFFLAQLLKRVSLRIDRTLLQTRERRLTTRRRRLA